MIALLRGLCARPRSHVSRWIGLGAVLLAGLSCSEPSGPVPTPNAAAVVPAPPTPSTAPTRTSAPVVATSRLTTRPTKLTQIVVSDDGLSVRATFPASDLLDLPWIEVEELIDPKAPARITARQRPPRTVDIDTENILRLRIRFAQTRLSPTKRIIIRLDGGRGLDVSQSKSRVCRLVRTPAGRWLRDFGTENP